ncbi:MAG: acyl-CoA dehydrogenase family protein [Acidimicrobiales bacterium]
MDFELDQDQQALSGLAARILSERATEARLKAVEAEAAAGGDGVDGELWSHLATAGLLSAPLSEASGGGGMGLAGAGAVLEEVGRRLAPVPYLDTVVLAGLGIERYGSDELRAEHLGRIGDGRLVVAAALTEAQGDPRRPSTTAVEAGSGGSLVVTGEKICVPAGLAAGAFLVPATLPDGTTCVALVESGQAGVTVERQDTTSSRPQARVRFESVEVPGAAVLGTGRSNGSGKGSERGAVLDWVVEHATAGLCVQLAGCLDEALRLTAGYVKERKQFDRTLASFQAVGQRAADAYVDSLAVRLTAWQALWRLSVGLPAGDEVTIAKYWAAEAGQRVVHTCQHLHGGVGMDRDYPIHRYFLLAKETDLLLGGAAPQLAELGRRIAASARIPASA